MNQAETPIPTRARPFEKAQKPTPAWLKAILGRELSPSRSEYQAVTQALWDGDKPMDDLVAWMFEAESCVNGLAHGSGFAASLDGERIVVDGRFVLGHMVEGSVTVLRPQES